MTKLLVRLFINNNKDISNPLIRRKYGYLSGFVGIIINIILFGGKLIAGILSSSIAIIADAFNNLSDAGSSIIALIGFKMSGKPADNEHPFGHGRIEYVSGFIISVIIIFMGFEIAKTSVSKIIHPKDITFSSLSLIILIVSVFAKLWLGLFNRKLGTSINSDVMKATAIDSLTDMLSTTAVIAGILITKYVGINIDGYLGILVALFILYSGISASKETINKLLGEAPDKDFINQVTTVVLSHTEIIGIHDFIVHNYGVGNCVISLHAEVPCDSDIMKIHDVIDNVEDEVNKDFNCITVIHMDPIATNDEKTMHTKKLVKIMLAELDPILTIHDFRMVHGETHTNVLFDVVTPFNYKYKDEELIEIISEKVKNINPLFVPKIMIDKICM